jgi:hypothetical protein
MADTTLANASVVNAAIAGPSAAELRRALAPKSLDRISAELNERQIDAGRISNAEKNNE